MAGVRKLGWGSQGMALRHMAGVIKLGWGSQGTALRHSMALRHAMALRHMGGKSENVETNLDTARMTACATWLLIVAALAVFMAPSTFAQSRAKRVTPVDGAQRSGLSELRYSASDVGAQGYTVIPLKDSAATRPAILHAVRNVGEVLDRGRGTVVFFFPGHGFAVPGRLAVDIVWKRDAESKPLQSVPGIVLEKRQ